MKKLLLLIILLLAINNLFAQTVAHQRCAAFERGMNISNWLEAPWQTNWPTETGYTKADLQLMKDAGIKSLRLPINFAEISDSVYPFNLDTAHVLFQRIDTVIKWADELSMNLIIDNHHGWELTNANWRNHKDRFAKLWGTVAKKYQYLDPEHYFFELLNEPPIAFNDLDSLNLLFTTAIDSIRNYTTAHSIIVSPNLGSWGMAFDLYRPLEDTNLIYTWHCYDPIDFTHQGFSWGTQYPAGTPFPYENSFYEQFLYTGLQRVIHWKDSFDMPLFLGEFGVSEHADADSRCNWVELITHTTDSMDIPWFYWDWRWDFSMFNGHVISEDSIIPCFKYALHLYSDTVSGIGEQQLVNNGIYIYPNPVSQLLNIKGADFPANIMIADAAGRLVYQGIMKERTDVSFLSPGYYTVFISGENKSSCLKLLKE
jgi:endoglucanase